MNITDKSTWFESELKKLEKDNDAIAYKHILDFSETVLSILDKKGIKNKNKFLAKNLKVSPAYISKLFNGNTNFTVKKLVEIASVIDYELSITLRPKLSSVKAPPVYETSVSVKDNLINFSYTEQKSFNRENSSADVFQLIDEHSQAA